MTNKKMPDEMASIKKLIKILGEGEDYLSNLSSQIGKLRNAYEIPLLVADMKKLADPKKVKNITTSFLQRRYKIGYSRAVRLMDALQEEKIVK